MIFQEQVKNVKINKREKFPNIKLENRRKIRNYRDRERDIQKKTEQKFADHGTEDRRGAWICRDSHIKYKDFQY